MIEKYGVEDKTTYEVVVPKPGVDNEFQVVGSQLTLPEATTLANSTSNAIVRPEK